MNPLSLQNSAAALGGVAEPCPVPMLQHWPEFAALLGLYVTEKPKAMLEVGTYHGGTLWHWLRNAQPGAHVVSVDSYVTGVDNRHLYDDWTPEGVNLTVIEGNSHDRQTVSAVGEHFPYDFVFIDAGHYYPEVKGDWDRYSPLVKPGGLIALHDILTHPTHPEIEVGVLWAQIKELGWESWEFIQDTNAEWGGIGVVRIP